MCLGPRYFDLDPPRMGELLGMHDKDGKSATWLQNFLAWRSGTSSAYYSDHAARRTHHHTQLRVGR